MIELCSTSDCRPAFENAFSFAQKQVRALIERDPDFYPMYTEGGKWRHTGEAWTHWCDGFLPGMMWIFHSRTGDAEWRRQAERYTTPLEPRKMDRTVHDQLPDLVLMHLRRLRPHRCRRPARPDARPAPQIG